jgi:arylsulfatase A-like enzyme
MGAVAGAARVALAVGGLAALVDVWQVAAVSPGSLSLATVGWLAGLYLAAALVAGLALGAVGAVLGLGAERARALTASVVTGVGAAILLAESGLRQFQPLSPVRPWIVAGACLVGLLLAALARRGRRVPPGVVVAGIVLFAIGGFGAVRGFAVPQRNAPMPGAPAAGSARGPNVLVVLIDTLRADHLGCYGYDRPTSPAIDAFAREGVQFLRAYSQSTWTKPATASFMTGRYPRQHQAYLEKSKLPETELLLPEALRAAGYRTGVFSGNPWITREWGFDQGVDHFVSVYDERFARVTLFMMSLKRLAKLVDHRARVYNRVKMLVQGELTTTARDVVVSDAFVRWIERHRGDRFYAHLHLMSPHHPYDPPPPFDRFVPDPKHEPVTYYPKKSFFFFEEGAALPEAARADMVARYDGDILFADDVFGRLMARLRRLGVLDETLVVLVSDHGEEFYDHRNWGHGQSVYDELTRVPLIMRHPALFPAGRRIETPVMTVDVMPTILEAVGAKPLDEIAGRSLLPLLSGAAQPPPETYAELIYRYGEARALVEGTQKVIHMRKDQEGRAERYDLGADPDEQVKLDTSGPEARRLLEHLDAITRWGNEHRSAAVEAEMDAEMQKRLKALGYLE